MPELVAMKDEVIKGDKFKVRLVYWAREGTRTALGSTGQKTVSRILVITTSFCEYQGQEEHCQTQNLTAIMLFAVLLVVYNRVVRCQCHERFICPQGDRCRAILKNLWERINPNLCSSQRGSNQGKRDLLCSSDYRVCANEQKRKTSKLVRWAKI